MKLRSYAKINLTLDILSKREDGYHNLETVYQTVDLYDEIKLNPASGIDISCNVNIPKEKNLAYIAANKLKDKYSVSKGVMIKINKKIPIGAGLSGGSSNAASVLKGLNVLWDLNLSKEELIEVGAEIGMDVPFHILGGTCIGKGRGEDVKKIKDIDKKYVVIVYPGFSVKTKEAYVNLDYSKIGQKKSSEKFVKDYDLKYLHNDFEDSVFERYPQLMELKKKLGSFCLLSGSGSSVFRIYESEEQAKSCVKELQDKYKHIFLIKTINKRIELAKEMGYCFGVKRAIEKIDMLANERKIFVLGKLIHNPQVVARLEKEGVKMIDSVEGIPSGTVVISAHGNSDKIIADIKERGFTVIDLTCPLVEKVHKITKEAEKNGRKVLVYGDSNHTEVKGIVGNLHNYRVIKNFNDVKREDLNCEVTLVSQTTREVDLFNDLVDKIRNVSEKVEVKDTICIATKDRQKSAIELAKKSDLMIVIGGRISSNTIRLYEICSQYTETKHVETAAEIESDWFNSSESVGITAGASTPDFIIQDVKNRIEMIL